MSSIKDAFNRPYLTGTQVNYYLICHRKLWLFSHNISMEHTSEAVEIGSLVHEYSYERKNKELVFDGIKIDFFDKNHGVIHEVKNRRRWKRRISGNSNIIFITSKAGAFRVRED